MFYLLFLSRLDKAEGQCRIGLYKNPAPAWPCSVLPPARRAKAERGCRRNFSRRAHSLIRKHFAAVRLPLPAYRRHH